MPIVAHRAELSSFWIPVAIAILIGSVTGWLAPTRFLESGVSTIAGIFVGICVDTGIDIYYVGTERNLFGIELIVWTALLAVPLALAAWVSGALRQRFQNGPSTGAV